MPVKHPSRLCWFNSDRRHLEEDMKDYEITLVCRLTQIVSAENYDDALSISREIEKMVSDVTKRKFIVENVLPVREKKFSENAVK